MQVIIPAIWEKVSIKERPLELLFSLMLFDRAHIFIHSGVDKLDFA